MLKSWGFLGFAIAAISLAGCGSSTVSRDAADLVVGDIGAGDAGPETSRVFADVTGDGTQIQSLAQALVAGDTVTARQESTSAVRIGFDQTASRTDADLKLRVNDAGELTMILNGVEHVFTENDRLIENGNFVGYDVQDPVTGEFYGLFTFSSFDMDDFLDPNNTRAAQSVRGHSSRVTEDGSVWAFAVTGAETRDETLTSLPTATYSGRSVTDIYPSSGLVGIQESRTRLRSDVLMVADFGGGTVSGEMTNLTQSVSGNPAVDLAGQINMDPAMLNGNGFNGTLSPDATFSAANGDIDGTYSGAFYGATAEGVAGALSIQGTDSIGHGFFGADRQ